MYEVNNEDAMCICAYVLIRQIMMMSIMAAVGFFMILEAQDSRAIKKKGVKGCVFTGGTSARGGSEGQVAMTVTMMMFTIIIQTMRQTIVNEKNIDS